MTTGPQPAKKTRAEQRAATRQSIIDATIDCLVEDGYANLSTRGVAQRATVAQSTIMFHFPTREALLIDAVLQMAMNLADQLLERIDLAALRTPAHRADVLDQAWEQFTSPQALATAELWGAVWHDPKLAEVLRTIETELSAILIDTTSALLPELADDPRLPAMLDALIALVRGFITSVPVWGTDAISARWQATKPLLLDAATHILDD